MLNDISKDKPVYTLPCMKNNLLNINGEQLSLVFVRQQFPELSEGSGLELGDGSLLVPVYTVGMLELSRCRMKVIWLYLLFD